MKQNLAWARSNLNSTLLYFISVFQHRLLYKGNLGNFMLKPTYHFWAQWIGTNTRVNDLVFNTEYRKCHKITEQDISDPSNLLSYSEEDLLDMMNFAQVKLTV